MGLVIGTGGIHIGTSGGGASPVKRFDAEAEYIKRKAGGTDNIGTGKAKISTLKGKSVVWNQIISNGNFESTSGWQTSHTTLTVANNVGSFTPEASGLCVYKYITGTTGHKYYTAISVKATSGDVKFYCGGQARPHSGSGAFERIALVVTKASSALNPQIDDYRASGWDEIQIKDAVLFDLTLMFGAGNEPSTVAEFEAMYPLPYYDHNPGEIVNNAAEAIETVGFNQWDEEWEVGNISPGDGTTFNDASRIRSKNYIPVVGGASYYFYNGANKEMGLFAYDGSKNFIGTFVSDNFTPGVNASTNVTGRSVTLPVNCGFIKFRVVSAYGTTYNNDICINLSDAAKNGTYKPYEKYTLQLGLDAFDVKDSEDNVITVNGLKSAGSVFDEIDLARGKYIKRVGEVDMGTLTYTLRQSYSTAGDAYTQVPSAPVAKGVFYKMQVCCDRLISKESNIRTSISESSFVNLEPSYPTIQVRVEDHTMSAEQLKASLSGVTLYYELATPIEYDLVTPIGNSYKVISGGTEERLPRDTASSVIAPIKYSVKYVQPKE